MTIHIGMHTRLIKTHGEKVIHYKATLCSCSPSGRLEEADVTCVKCSGLGVFWNEPRTITALILGLDSDRAGKVWLQNGIALPEDMSCSPYPGYPRRFRDYDKIVPTWKRGFPYPGELLRRGKKDTLIYKPVGKISKISQVNPLTGEEKIFINPEDFAVGGSDGKTILWVNGKGPKFDDVYSVMYEPRFEFVSWSPPAPRWEKGREIGMRLLLRKVHLPWPATNWT